MDRSLEAETNPPLHSLLSAVVFVIVIESKPEQASHQKYRTDGEMGKVREPLLPVSLLTDLVSKVGSCCTV